MKIDENTYKKMPAGLQALFVKLPNYGSDEVVSLFPESGNGSGNPTVIKRQRNKGWCNKSPGEGVDAIDNYGDSGSAARFFYCAKASRAERNAGLDGMEEVTYKLKDDVSDDIRNSIMQVLAL